MLEWMKSLETKSNFRFDGEAITEKEVEKFIEKANEDFYDPNKRNLHLAIVNEEDIYLGTISLKNINYIDLNAEYAISLRSCARGTSTAMQSTLDVLKIAFDDMKLHKVYLNVFSENVRAIRFYHKVGFTYEGEFRDHLFIQDTFKSLKWFSITETEYLEIRRRITNENNAE